MDVSNKKLVLRCVLCDHHPMEPICPPACMENAKVIPFICSECGKYITLGIEEVNDEA